MEQITTVGVDLAKSVFSLHAVERASTVVLRKTVRRDQLLETVSRACSHA
jgi:transposase